MSREIDLPPDALARQKMLSELNIARRAKPDETKDNGRRKPSDELNTADDELATRIRSA